MLRNVNKAMKQIINYCLLWWLMAVKTITSMRALSGLLFRACDSGTCLFCRSCTIMTSFLSFFNMYAFDSSNVNTFRWKSVQNKKVSAIEMSRPLRHFKYFMVNSDHVHFVPSSSIKLDLCTNRKPIIWISITDHLWLHVYALCHCALK